MRKTISFILLLMVVGALQGAVPLKFNSNGKFKIVQLTDVHYIYNDERSKPAETCINNVLEKERPDLVMLTGDIIFGKPGKESLQTVLNLISKFKVPFAITFGNHDDEQGLSKDELMKIAMEYPYNISTPSDGITGTSNYVLPIQSGKGRRNAEVLYVIDSNTYSHVPGVKGYDYIHFDQIEWYRNQSRRFASENGGKPLPSMAFFHIPVPEFTEAACSGSAILYGSRTESVCSPVLNTGFFAAAKEMGDIRAVPFAITFGNHDDEQGLSKDELMKIAMEYPYNISTPSDGITGTSNYVLPIQSGKGRRNAEVLYVIDSNTYSHVPGVKGYDYIHFDQIEWYRNQSRRFASENGGKPLPSMAFFHIPVPEFTEAACSGSAILYGSRTESVCSPVLNTGFFAAAKEMGDIRAMFVGHDHDNDYAVMWHNILLAYGRYSGGKTVYNNLPVNGARVIELNEESTEFATWIRLSNGDVEQRITCPGSFQKK